MRFFDFQFKVSGILRVKVQIEFGTIFVFGLSGGRVELGQNQAAGSGKRGVVGIGECGR